jgi:hypothetical protein
MRVKFICCSGNICHLKELRFAYKFALECASVPAVTVEAAAGPMTLRAGIYGASNASSGTDAIASDAFESPSLPQV